MSLSDFNKGFPVRLEHATIVYDGDAQFKEVKSRSGNSSAWYRLTDGQWVRSCPPMGKGM